MSEKKRVGHEKVKQEYRWTPRTTESDDLSAAKVLFLFHLKVF